MIEAVRALERVRLLEVIKLLRVFETPLTVTRALLTALERLDPCDARIDTKAFETPAVWTLMLVLSTFEAVAKALERLDPWVTRLVASTFEAAVRALEKLEP